MKGRHLIILAVFAGLSTLPSAPVEAGAFLATGEAVVPPSGFIRFCVQHAQECLGAPTGPATVQLTEERRRQLEAVEVNVNREIAPKENPKHFWEYAKDGAGDCNTYALTKRAALIELGWPTAALRLAAVFTEHNEPHLVLVAHTTDGDFVLDNRVLTVRDWSTLPYRWVAMQSAQSPARWLKIVAEPVVTADANRAEPRVNASRSSQLGAVQ
jgi:predicted transglutaminase-like cysteine proteinase